MHWRRKWQPTPVFLPGDSQGQGSLVGCRLWGCTPAGLSPAGPTTWKPHQLLSPQIVPSGLAAPHAWVSCQGSLELPKGFSFKPSLWTGLSTPNDLQALANSARPDSSGPLLPCQTQVPLPDLAAPLPPCCPALPQARQPSRTLSSFLSLIFLLDLDRRPTRHPITKV